MVDIISILQHQGYGIYGSVIYEYIFRCSVECIPWKKYESLVSIVQKKPITISNINIIAPDADRYHELETLLKCICSCQRKIYPAKKFNIAEYTLEFDNPFSDNFTIDLEISATNIEDIPFSRSDHEELISSLSLWDSDFGSIFTIFRTTPNFKTCLAQNLKLTTELNLADVQSFGVIGRIGKFITSNVVFLDLCSLGVFYSTRRIKTFKSKGYDISIMYDNTHIYIRNESAEPLKESCPICMETEEKETSGEVTLECSHTFHLRCLSTWFKSPGQVRNCPLCRHSIAAPSVISSFAEI